MNVRIRPLEINDAYKSVEWRNMPELWEYTKFDTSKEISINDELDWIQKVTKDTSSARFAIIVDDDYVGNIYLTDIKNGIGEYHIFIGEKNYWGKGVARKASQQIIDFGRDTLKLNFIELGVNEANSGAYHLYKSLGFEKVGLDDVGFIRMELSLNNTSIINAHET